MLEFKVRCMNKLHKIVLTNNGQMCLVNHDKADREELKALSVLGSTYDVRCIRIRDNWRCNKLSDAQKAEMPDMLYRLWNIRNAAGKDWRLARKKSLKCRHTFMDFTIKQPYPDKILKITPVQIQHETMRSFALSQVEKELVGRGFTVTKEDGYFEPYAGASYKIHKAVLTRINNRRIYADFGSGNGSKCAVWMPRITELPIICNEYIYVSAIADLIELKMLADISTIWRESVHRKLISNDRMKSCLKALMAYPALSKVRLSLAEHDHIPVVKFAMQIGLLDQSALSILASEINKIVTKLVADRRAEVLTF